MKNSIDKNKIDILERELAKVTTDFYIAELLYSKYQEKIFYRYSNFLRDIADHYAYTAIVGIYKIFDKGNDTNRIFKIINELTDIQKRSEYTDKANKIKTILQPVLDRRNEIIAHSNIVADSNSSILYKTYSPNEYRQKIKPAINSIGELLFELRGLFNFEGCKDCYFAYVEHEADYVLDALILAENTRGYH